MIPFKPYPRGNALFLLVHFILLLSERGNASASQKEDCQKGLGPFCARITLEEVQAEARKANPDLLALQAQAQAAKLQADTHFYLPPPRLSVGSMGMQGPVSSDGHMQTSYQLSQEIPFPGKVASRKEAAEQEGAASGAATRARTLTLQAEVRKTYADYWKAERMQELLAERFEGITAHSRRLRSGSLSTRLMQAHLVAAGTDLDLIRNDIDSAQQLEISARALLNGLMGRDPFSPLAPAEERPLSPLPPAPTSDRARDLVDNHPIVRESRSLIQAAQSLVSASGKELLPDLMLALRYNENTPNAADRSNTEVMVGVTLPFLYFWQPAAARHAAESKLVQAEAELVARRSSLRLLLVQRYSEVASLRSRLLRFQDTILRASERRLQIAHGIAPTDMESLDEHRNATESHINLQSQALSLRTDFEKALAEYEILAADLK